MAGNLHYEERGNPSNPVLVFLHGLLGSSRNWRSVSKVLSEKFHTVSFDLPNHGQSFHQDTCTVNTMAEDISLCLDRLGFHKFSICGHSLGGKVAMRLACDFPKAVDQLIVVDIAPRTYPAEHHLPTLTALLDLELSKIESRKEVDHALTEKIPNWAFRQFLLTNLEMKNGVLTWLPNLQILRRSIQFLSANPLQSTDQFSGPSLFIRGGKSGYVRNEHFQEIKKYFPEAQIETLANAGHDLHVEDREGFLSSIGAFLKV